MSLFYYTKNILFFYHLVYENLTIKLIVNMKIVLFLILLLKEYYLISIINLFLQFV